MRRRAILLLLPVLLCQSLMAQAAPPKVQWLPAATDATEAWQPLLDRATLTLGRYRLRVGATDDQPPHDRDEVYWVLAGKAKCTAAGATRSVGKGSAVFVAARQEHRFHDIEADLDLLVFFSAAAPASGGMAEGPTPTEQTPYPETSPRAATRTFYWFGEDSAGQVAIDHGQPRWNARYESFLTTPAPGGKAQRWRCGENFWTTLDTNMPLSIGGVAVPVGLYYVVLQHDPDLGLALVLLDPREVRQQRLDAYEVTKTHGGIVVPLRTGAAAIAATRLQIELRVDRSEKDRGSLCLRFGPHELTAEVRMQPR